MRKNEQIMCRSPSLVISKFWSLPMDFAQFQGLISQFLTPKNDQLRAAEEQYQKIIQEDPNSVILYLLNTIDPSSELSTRSLALILLLHFYEPSLSSIFPSITKETHSIVLQRLPLFFSLEIFEPENMALVSYNVAVIASIFLMHNAYPEFYNQIIQIALQLDSILAPAAIDCMREALLRAENSINYIDLDLVNLLIQKIFTDETDANYKTAGIRFIYCLFNFNGIRENLMQFSQPTAELISNLTTPQIFLDLLFFLVYHIEFFVPSYDIIYQTIINVMSNPNTDQLRTLAINVAIHFIQKLPEESKQYLHDLLLCLMNFAATVDDSGEYDDFDTLAGTADSNIKSIAQIEQVHNEYLEIIWPMINEFISTPDWHQNHAALVALKQSLVGQCDILLNELPQITTCIISHFSHQHFLVRRAALYALAQASSSLSPDLQINYHIDICNSLLQLLASETYAITRAAALTSLSIYVYHSPENLIIQTCDDLMKTLLPLSNDPDQSIQTQFLRCVSSIAHIVGSQLSPYYGSIMEWLMKLISLPAQDVSESLRARAIEAITYIGNCVDDESFYPSAEQFLGIILNWKWKSIFKSDQIEYIREDELEKLFFSLKQICQRFPTLIQHYLEPIMELLIELVSNPPKSSNLPYFKADFNLSNDRLTYLYKQNTIIEYEKNELYLYQLTLDTINTVAWSVSQAFVPYIQPLGKTIFALPFNFFFYKMIPFQSIQCMQHFADILIMSNDLMFFDKVLETYLQIVQHPYTVPFIALEALKMMKQILRSLCQLQIMTEEKVQQILEQIPVLLQRFENPLQDINPTDIVPRESLEIALGNIVHFFFQRYQELTYNFFSETLGPLVPIDLDVPSAFRLIVWTDYYLLSETLQYEVENQILLYIQNSLGSTSPLIAQTGFLSHAYLFSKKSLTSEFVQESYVNILTAISSCEKYAAETGDNNGAKQAIDGALIALVKLMENSDNVIDFKECFQMWINYMPITTELEETSNCYYFFVNHLLTNNEYFPITTENIIKTIDIIAVASNTKLVDTEINGNMKNYLIILLNDPNTQEFTKQCIEELEKNKRQKVLNLLNLPAL